MAKRRPMSPEEIQLQMQLSSVPLIGGFLGGANALRMAADPDIDMVPGVSFPRVNNALPSSTTPTTEETKQLTEAPFATYDDGSGSYGGTGGSTAASSALIQEILAKRAVVDQAYKALFGDIDAVARERAKEIESTAGENVNKLTDQYLASIPGIDNSYAAVGSFDSTYKGDARKGADDAFKSSTAEVGKNKEADLAKVGSYVSENKAKYGAEKDSILKMIDRANETTDEGDLREARNQIESSLAGTNAARGALKTDEGARGELSKITADNGRFESIKDSLDKVMQSSLSGAVKSAAVQAVTSSSDLSDEEKNKVKALYGDAYTEQAKV